MAKTPFPYKPSKPLPKGADKAIQLVGSGDVLASYSDVFVVTHEAETGMANLYFYQRYLDDRQAILGKTETGITAPKAKCISRIIMSPQAIDKLLESLAENRGYTITRKVEEKK